MNAGLVDLASVPLPQRYYAETVDYFLQDSINQIIGQLTIALAAQGFPSTPASIDALTESVTLLQRELAKLQPQIGSAGIVLEYPIPRRGKRIDAAILCGDAIIVIEFKVGEADIATMDREQVEDYCLDLRDFHSESQGKTLVPILLLTEYDRPAGQLQEPVMNVSSAIVTGPADLAAVLRECLTNCVTRLSTDAKAWAKGTYRPTPTIIEAACHLYANMNVVDIARSSADASNLAATTQVVLNEIDLAKANHEKTICFITGVPGAGKTLAGLNIVHNVALHQEGDLGVFLSGNGPLVRVLREALARDESLRNGSRRNVARRKSATFVQNVHDFLREYSENLSPPPDRVIIFDEAQRAWNAEHSFRKFKRPKSEPEMMLEIMSRHSDWSVIVCLIGGGQEINTGEAGLPEWGRVLENSFPHWRVVISDRLLKGSHSTAGQPLFTEIPAEISVISHPSLHLAVSIRSYRAEKLSEWVAYVLSNEPATARRILQQDLKNYPLYFTRSLEQARTWLRVQRRGSRRSGIIASSSARRLRPHGIDVTLDLEEEHWFLAPADDVRSSSFLELPATEFGVQGLELDWTCVCWGADLRRANESWSYHQFKGTKWCKVADSSTKQYMLNKYRVLLTRAREGCVIWIPPGSAEDVTRTPAFYNKTAEYLRRCGVPPLVSNASVDVA